MKQTLLIVVAFFCFSVNAQQQFTVYFGNDMSVVNDSLKIQLDKWIKDNKNATVLKISGYTDSSGSTEYDLALSQRRANNIKAYLNANRVRLSPQIEAVGYGKSNATANDDIKSRKVVIEYSLLQAAAVPEPSKTSFLIGRQKVKANVGDVIRLKSIAFFPVSDKVLPECYPYLDDLVKALKANPKLKIEIQGHNCCESSPLVSLGKAMAETVYLYLIDKKIDKSRLSYTGFGGSKPIYPIPEKNNSEREANSRVEIKILEN